MLSGLEPHITRVNKGSCYLRKFENMGEGKGETHKEPWNTVFPWPVVHKIVDKLREKC